MVMIVKIKPGRKTIMFFIFFILFIIVLPRSVHAASPFIDISIGGGGDDAAIATSVQLIFLLAIITLVPTLLLMVTCFPRILIAFHFLRAAMGTQQMPPNQILIALALFMTFAFMGNIFVDINNNALQPLSNGEISREVAFERGMAPIREFILANVEPEDVRLFWELSGREAYDGVEEIPNEVLIPSFLLGEIKKGFQFGVMIYIPFIVIDMVVASILMSMGMMMLPPAMISMPFKILLFVSVGGWNMAVTSIMESFR